MKLLRIIANEAPGSIVALARITGKAESNLSRMLRTMERYGLVRLECSKRGRVAPKVMHDRAELICRSLCPGRQVEHSERIATTVASLKLPRRVAIRDPLA